MKFYSKLICFLAAATLISCEDKPWNDGYDVNFPVPSIESVDKVSVEFGDTISMVGSFEKVKNVTIGNGFTKILEVSEDNTKMKVLVTETCAPGKLVVENLYKKIGTYKENIFVDGEVVIVIPDEIVLMDWSDKAFNPQWTASGWTEVKDFDEKGWDLNKDRIAPPDGYKHYFSMNDTLLFPPAQAQGQGGNIPYGNYTTDNQGSGWDLSCYEDPYVSVLINTGNDIAYLSLVWEDKIIDFQPGDGPNGRMANGEKGHFMKTDNKWIWYSFPLKKMVGEDYQPLVKSAGLFIRNSWDYGADIYPGFQLNIASMVVTEGPLPRKQVIFDFDKIAYTEGVNVTGWAADALKEFGINKSKLAQGVEGENYYSMINPNSEKNKNYKFGVKSDNNGEGWDFSKMKHPYLTFAINTGDRSGYVDFVFYQEASGNKDAEPWADPSAKSAVGKYAEGNNCFYETKGQWEWRTYDLVQLLNSVEEWGKQNGAYPDFKAKFDYVTIWPRDGWGADNDKRAESYELSIDYVIVTDGLPTGLPELNKK